MAKTVAFAVLLSELALVTMVTGVRSSDLVLDRVSRLEHDLKDMSKELHLTKTDLGSTKAMLQSTRRDLESTKEELRLTKTDTLTGKRARRSTHVVSFQVNQKFDRSFYNKEVFKFDTVMINTGNAYNQITGIFTAPVAGTYRFWANIMGFGGSQFAVLLKKQGREVVRGFTGHDLTFGTATINYIVKLWKGDRVWFENEERQGTKIHGLNYSNYGGSLL